MAIALTLLLRTLWRHSDAMASALRRGDEKFSFTEYVRSHFFWNVVGGGGVIYLRTQDQLFIARRPTIYCETDKRFFFVVNGN